MFFKGGSGILNPVDVNGKEIKEGSILTHCYFRPDRIEFNKKYFPNRSEEQNNLLDNQPAYIVKWNPKGFFYGEGLKKLEPMGNRLYMHDFEFKHTKVIE